MTPPPASVIVVSRHRAAQLQCCLAALAQQDHPEFEVIVVADPAGIAAARATGLSVRPVPFDEANISAARNAGLALAAAPVVAFIDDDATAEPTWLSRLTAPFQDPQVGAATGFVRGRNGISLQWGAAWVDRSGQDHPFEMDEAGGLYAPKGDQVIKTQGTNCAFRRDLLLAIGGFDPAFRFYLDEVDVNLRMRAVTAVVPLAQVVHGFAESARRRADRVPLSLHDIGASTACLLRRHLPEAGPAAAAVAGVIAAQTRRIETLRAARRITVADAAALMQSLMDGLRDGDTRVLPDLPAIPPATGFAPLPGTGPRPGVVLSGRIWHRHALMKRATQAVAEGAIVTVLILSPTTRPHRHGFDPRGFWLQRGGLFGRSLRDAPRFRLIPFRKRIAQEAARWARYRPLTDFTYWE
ncbi:glycosyltransferase [Paracoccaceae bacterium]